MKTLPRDFYDRKTLTVAKELLGKTLVRVYRNQRISGIITEVEAYTGVTDRACHSYGNRRTKRTEVMFGESGHAYIYLIYGIHHCFNVVTESVGKAEAVLVRALEPIEGIPLMAQARRQRALKNLTNGPGKLGEALYLDKTLNGVALDSKILFIEDGPKITPDQIVKRPRIGVDYAGDHADRLYRFYIGDSEFVSRK